MAEDIKVFDSPNFNVENYTKELLKDCVGGADIQQRKKEIQAYAEQTSALLKRSVYANYMQFIETAKEISHLESEMYQLSHILAEQRNILSTFTEDIANNLPTSDDDECKKSASTTENNHATRAIKEMVEGYEGDLEGKTFLNEGALIELHPTDYRPIQRVFFFLFNDVLIVCKVKHDKRLEYLTEYDPKKIAVINIKDLEGIRNAINIITSDGSKIYQSITAAGKTEWIEKLEVAFRFDQQKLQASKQKKQEVKEINEVATSPTEELDVNTDAEDQPLPDWMITALEDIQTLIAQRYFEDAQSLIERTRDYLAKATQTNVKNISIKVNDLEQQLSNVLLQELSNCHCRNLQVTLRSSRRSLKVLVQIGKARQACSTLLQVCTNAIRISQREARRNNKQISEIFFCDLAEVVCLFLQAFQDQNACVSCLVVWCNAELQYFTGQVIKHYLAKGTHLDAVAKCMESIREPCSKLRKLGLDLNFQLEGLLHNTLEQLIDESRVRLLKSVGRSSETWQPYNLQTKSNLKRTLQELDNLGIDLRPHTIGDTWIGLTQTTVLFTRHYLQIAEYCGTLARNNALISCVENLMCDLYMAQYNICSAPDTQGYDAEFVSKNIWFLSDILLPTAIEKYQKFGGIKTGMLSLIQQKLQRGKTTGSKEHVVYQTELF